MEGTQLRTVWEVKAINGDPDGSDNYAADIDIVLAEGEGETVGDVLPASNETVTIGFDPDLECGGRVLSHSTLPGSPTRWERRSGLRSWLTET